MSRSGRAAPRCRPWRRPARRARRTATVPGRRWHGPAAHGPAEAGHYVRRRPSIVVSGFSRTSIQVPELIVETFFDDGIDRGERIRLRAVAAAGPADGGEAD